MKTILVGFDGSEPSERALARSAEIAKAFGGAVHVASVAPVLVGTGRSMGRYDPTDPPAEHAEQIDRALASLAEAGIQASPAPAHGDPADAILELADQVDADLVVLGSHE